MEDSGGPAQEVVQIGTMDPKDKDTTITAPLSDLNSHESQNDLNNSRAKAIELNIPNHQSEDLNPTHEQDQRTEEESPYADVIDLLYDLPNLPDLPPSYPPPPIPESDDENGYDSASVPDSDHDHSDSSENIYYDAEEEFPDEEPIYDTIADDDDVIPSDEEPPSNLQKSSQTTFSTSSFSTTSGSSSSGSGSGVVTLRSPDHTYSDIEEEETGSHLYEDDEDPYETLPCDKAVSSENLNHSLEDQPPGEALPEVHPVAPPRTRRHRKKSPTSAKVALKVHQTFPGRVYSSVRKCVMPQREPIPKAFRKQSAAHQLPPFLISQYASNHFRDDPPPLPLNRPPKSCKKVTIHDGYDSDNQESHLNRSHKEVTSHPSDQESKYVSFIRAHVRTRSLYGASRGRSANGNTTLNNQLQAERLAAKLKRKFQLSGDEIPVNAGTVKEDFRGTGTDLKVKQGETVLILKMDGCPPGKWVAKSERGKIGYVDLSNIALDPESVRTIMLISPPFRLCDQKLEKVILSGHDNQDGSETFNS